MMNQPKYHPAGIKRIREKLIHDLLTFRMIAKTSYSKETIDELISGIEMVGDKLEQEAREKNLKTKGWLK